MGDMATLRMAQQELEDLYLGVPDDSVNLTFKDLAVVLPPPSSSTSSSSLPVAAVADSPTPPPLAAVDERKRTTTDLSTNIFTYRPLDEDRDQEDDDTLGRRGGGGGALLQLPSSPLPPPPRLLRHHGPASAAVAATNDGSAAVAGGDRWPARNRQRPGIPHSNICALCNKYVYLARHRCLVCGRVYCRRCVGAGMGDMTEGRKCIDCLGRRYSHRYIHRAGDTAAAGCGCCPCFWGYYPSAKAVTEQELVWAEKGPAPRRRPRHRPAAAGPSSTSTSYAAGGGYSSSNTVASASMSMAINSDNTVAVAGSSVGGMPAYSASSSFVASYVPNPHALPL